LPKAQKEPLRTFSGRLDIKKENMDDFMIGKKENMAKKNFIN